MVDLTGAEIEVRSNNGRTPLPWPAQNRREAVFQLLLEKSANIEIENGSAWTALQLAARNNHDGIEHLMVIHEEPVADDFNVL